MVLPGETIQTGAAETCPDCGVTPKIEVLSGISAAGHYIGTMCQCGPYSRESDYFRTRADAEKAFKTGMYGRK